MFYIDYSLSIRMKCKKENCNWQRKYQRAILLQTCLEKIQALDSWQKLVLSIRQNSICYNNEFIYLFIVSVCNSASELAQHSLHLPKSA